jgi:predicted Zn-dependent peptidase
MPIIGTEKNLRSFKKNDLFKYVKENYTLDRFYIVASGNIDHKDLLRFTDKYINKELKPKGRLRGGLILTPSGDLHVEKDIQQVHYISGKPTYGHKDKKRNIVSVLSHILGEGSSSRLFQTVREENGIAYQINTFLNSFYDISTFGVYLSTNEKSIHKAESLIAKEIQKIKSKKVGEIELNRAKEYLIGNMIMSLESTTNRMLRIAQSMIYFGKIKSVEDTVKHIHTVTSKEILEASNEIFDNGSLVRVILSPKNLLLKKAA